MLPPLGGNVTATRLIYDNSSNKLSVALRQTTLTEAMPVT